MTLADVFLFGGSALGWGALLDRTVKIAHERAYRADYRRAEGIAGPAIRLAISKSLAGLDTDPSFPAVCEAQSAEMDVADLALLDRFPYSPGFKDLVKPRLQEVRDWRVRRRRQPVRRLAAFVRSAAVG